MRYQIEFKKKKKFQSHFVSRKNNHITFKMFKSPHGQYCYLSKFGKTYQMSVSTLDEKYFKRSKRFIICRI